ncbi:MAG: gamma-glutamyl-gamma-aminobutyrate hydrolase family protein [Candidatus Dormibacteraeota bacterium]|nr:gamma-glutamyl-gamma-aminobutyrate hydrolase family protein [Candidatus Dormibacteraeota bacterium]
MSAKVRIGITCSPLRVAGYYDPYLNAIQLAGAEPVVIVPTAHRPGGEEAGRMLAQFDGLLVPGGWDVSPKEYGGNPVDDVTELDPALDHTEIELVRAAADSGTPVLGICRGQQLINVALGGSLLQHIDGHDHHGEPRHTLAHAVEVDSQSELGRVAPRTLMVNSLHHQAIGALAPTLRATAYSTDHIIEAVESSDGAIVAVQAHPEELIDYHSWARALFERFVERSANRARRDQGTPAGS